MGKGKRLRAERERRHEEHARLVVERSGDPEYAHRRRTDTGAVYEMNPEMLELMRDQIERFRQRFGREPGPDDPVFFDPAFDVPTPIDSKKATAELRRAINEAGVDPGFADASEELGFLLTEGNRHMFSANEVDAWDEAVDRSRKRAAEEGDES